MKTLLRGNAKIIAKYHKVKLNEYEGTAKVAFKIVLSLRINTYWVNILKDFLNINECVTITHTEPKKGKHILSYKCMSDLPAHHNC